MSYYDGDDEELEEELEEYVQQESKPKPKANSGSNSNQQSPASNVANRIKEKAMGNKLPMSGGMGLKDKAKNGVKNAAKNAAKNIGKAIKEAWKKVPVALKIKIYLIAGIAALVIIAAAAIIMIFKQTEATGQSVKSAATNLQQQIDDGTYQGDIEQLKQAMEWYTKDGSFIGFTQEQLQGFYDANQAELENTTTGIKEAYSSFYGTIDSKDLNGKISKDEKRELYKHILNMEKYNFNEIKWVEYSHSHVDGNTIDKANLTYDEGLDLYWPKYGDTELKTLINLTKPYLFNWRFAVAFTSAASFSEAQTNQLAKSMYQVMEDAQNKKWNDIGDFAYQIVKEGLSVITVNQYAVSRCVLLTQYNVYRDKTYNDQIKITYKMIKSPQRDDQGQIIKDENNNIQYGSESYYSNSSSVQLIKDAGASFDTDYASLEEKNTRKDENGVEQVLKEDVLSDETITKYTYYISYARAFDIIKQNEYEYTPYSRSDVDARTNEDSKIEKDPEDYYLVENEANRYVGHEGEINSAMTPNEIAAKYGGSAGAGTPTGNSYNSGDDVITEYTVTVNLGSYRIEKGQHHKTEWEWTDKLISKESKTEHIKFDDVIQYNLNEEGNSNKSTETKEDFEKEVNDVEYYKTLESDSEEYINTIDLLNSNPGIISNYLDASAKHSKYVGYSRSDFLYGQGIKNCKQLLDDLAGDKNKLPFAYGGSLGYATSGSGGAHYLSGLALLRKYINSFEGDGSTEGGGMFDENYKHVYDEEKAVYYKVYDAHDGVHTVGYGVNMEANREALEAAGINVSSVQYGDYLDKKIIDKIQEDIIKGRVDKVKGDTTGIELTEYQVHALVSHSYLSYSLGSFVELYNQYWNQEKDDKYEDLHERYKDTPGKSAEIMNEIDFNHQLFLTWFYYYNGSHDGNGAYPGWVTRQKSEFTLFQGGYYSTIKMFWGNSDGIPGGYVLVNGNDIDQAACLDLQVWYEQNLFSGKLQCDTDVTSGAARTATDVSNTDSRGNLNPEYSDIFRRSYIYQCPWWSYTRGALYYKIVGRDDLAEVLHGAGATGHGRAAATYAADYLHIPDKLNTSIDGIQPYSIISFDKPGSGYGHTAFVEAVTDDYIIISDCGSGVDWYGVHMVSKTTLTNPGSSYYFKNSICLADAL